MCYFPPQEVEHPSVLIKHISPFLAFRPLSIRQSPAFVLPSGARQCHLSMRSARKTAEPFHKLVNSDSERKVTQQFKAEPTKTVPTLNTSADLCPVNMIHTVRRWSPHSSLQHNVFLPD